MTSSTLRWTIIVDAPVERAFMVFTERFDSWWPRGHHIGTVEMARSVMEPRAGGRWYEVGVDGSECDWGTVLAWEPSRRLVLGWQIDGRWQHDADPSHASEVEVRFTALGEEQTEVALEHRRLDGLADAQALARGVGGQDGWPGILIRYAAAAK